MNFILLAILVVFSVFSNAYAADPVMAAMQNGINTINSMVTPHAINFGFQLFYYFIALGFVYYGFQFWATGGGFAFFSGDFLMFVIKACIPYLFLVHNSEVNSFVNSFFFGFAGLMMNAGASVSSLSDFPISDLLAKPLKIIIDAEAEFDKATKEYTFSFPDFGSLFAYYGAYILIMFISLFYALSILLMLVQFILGIVLLTIALSMAPLMTVFVNGWIFSGLFQSWLSFTMSSGFILIVGAVFIKIAESLILGFSGATDLSLVTYNPKGKSIDLNWANIFSLWLFTIVIFALARQVQVLAGQLGGGSVPNIGSVGDNRGKGTASSSTSGSTQKGGGSVGTGASMTNNFGGASAKGAVNAGAAVAQTAAKLARSIHQSGSVAGGISRAVSAARAATTGLGASVAQKANDWTKPY